MMRRLTLLRHAQAESQAPTGADVDRALSLTGRTQAKSLGHLLITHDAIPDLVLCSAANRAVETWKLLAAGLGDNGGDDSAIEVRRLPELYGADPGGLLETIRSVPQAVGSVLVVGHEPVVSHVARILAGAGSDETGTDRIRTGMSTAMLAFLRISAPWAGLGRGGAVLTGVDRPADGQ